MKILSAFTPPLWTSFSFSSCPSDDAFVAEVKVDLPSLNNLELQFKNNRLSAPLVVKKVDLTCIHVHALREGLRTYAWTSLRSNSPSLSAALRGAHCLICPYHSSIVDEAQGHRLNVII